jgi:hypothetical protein
MEISSMSLSNLAIMRRFRFAQIPTRALCRGMLIPRAYLTGHFYLEYLLVYGHNNSTSLVKAFDVIYIA